MVVAQETLVTGEMSPDQPLHKVVEYAASNGLKARANDLVGGEAGVFDAA